MKRSRRWFVLGALLCAGCGSNPKLLIELLPRQVGGAWTLASSQPLKTEALPPEVRSRGPASAVKLVYDGPSRITVTICEMKTGTSAFAVFQSWRARDGAQAFYHGRLFGIAEGADAGERMKFVRALQPVLPS